MKNMFSIGLIVALFSLIVLSGCISQNQSNTTGGNLMKGAETSGNEIVEGTYSDAENVMNSVETAKLKDNEVKHCVCHLMEIQYDYWIAKDELARETTFQGKVKQTITRQENCAVQDGIPKQCTPLDFDFDQLRNEWIKETETMTCNCDIVSYDKKYFN